MTREHLEGLHTTYTAGLLDDTTPFWLKHSIDRVHGGFTFCVDRDGSLVDSDKGIWQHGRFTWMLATLYNRVEPRPEWLEACKHGIDFMRNHAFDSDGRMFFQVTQEGQPLRKRRYVFSEAFGAMAFAAYAKASGDESAAVEARRLFDLFVKFSTEEGHIPPKVNPDTRPMQGIGPHMILINMGQMLRESLGDDSFTATIDQSIETIRTTFLKPDLGVVMETVGAQGEIIDHAEGRMLNPGHSIEAAWFIMEEGRIRGDQSLIAMGAHMLDWMWARGWDTEHGGLLYFVDVYGKPVQEYWHDMKFWWNHNETIIATLLAYELTGDEKYAQWHQLIHDWAYAHFPDAEHGEWFGYLHRDGSISSTLKGNLWKGPFHLPRMQLTCSEITARLLEKA
jgi:N-acylglucosamine 2-epimerase